MISALPVVPAVPKLIVCPSRIHAVAVDPVDTMPIEAADVAPGERVPTETSELLVLLSCSKSIEPMVTNSLEVTTMQLEFATLVVDIEIEVPVPPEVAKRASPFVNRYTTQPT